MSRKLENHNFARIWSRESLEGKKNPSNSAFNWASQCCKLCWWLNSDVASYADDTTPYSCATDITSVTLEL